MAPLCHMDLEVQCSPASHHYWDSNKHAKCTTHGWPHVRPSRYPSGVDAGQIPSRRPPVALPRPPVAALLMHGQSAPAAEASLLERP